MGVSYFLVIVSFQIIPLSAHFEQAPFRSYSAMDGLKQRHTDTHGIQSYEIPLRKKLMILKLLNHSQIGSAV